MRSVLRVFAAITGITAVLVLLAVWFTLRPYSFDGEIPQGAGYGSQVRFSGGAHAPRAVEAPRPPQHPFLAATPSSGMHGDGYNSGTHPVTGPLGRAMIVQSHAMAAFGGECATIAFDSRGRVVAVCATFLKFMVAVFDPATLRPLATFDLPGRASSRTLNLRKIMTDTSGGAYFFLDNRDRAVLVDADQRLRIIAVDEQKNGTLALRENASHDLKPLLRAEGDAVTAVAPDWNGRTWFVSRKGLVGYFDPATGGTATLALDGEEIENAPAVDRNAVYVVSDHALYAITARDGENPRIIWREPYRRATKQKIGAIDLGSGTTPTLIGDRWIAIADNADQRINVLVFDRTAQAKGERLVCSQPVFEPGHSVAEASMIGFAHTVVVSNNAGYDLFPLMMFGRTGAGGVVRVDFSPGTNDCRQVWESPVIAQSALPKLGLGSGLVYLYAKDPEAGTGIDAYRLTALDIETGRTVFSQLAGTGTAWDNNWGTTALGPDNCAYVGLLRGIARFCDGNGD